MSNEAWREEFRHDGVFVGSNVPVGDIDGVGSDVIRGGYRVLLKGLIRMKVHFSMIGQLYSGVYTYKIAKEKGPDGKFYRILTLNSPGAVGQPLVRLDDFIRNSKKR